MYLPVSNMAEKVTKSKFQTTCILGTTCITSVQYGRKSDENQIPNSQLRDNMYSPVSNMAEKVTKIKIPNSKPRNRMYLPVSREPIESPINATQTVRTTKFLQSGMTAVAMAVSRSEKLRRHSWLKRSKRTPPRTEPIR